MADDFEVHDASHIPVADLLEVLSAGYGRPFTADWFAWKHRDGPLGPSQPVVARDADGLLGVVFGLPWRFQADGAAIDGLRLVDGATTPRAVRRGVFRRVVNRLLDGWTPTDRPGIVVATATPEAQVAHVKNGATARTDSLLLPARQLLVGGRRVRVGCPGRIRARSPARHDRHRPQPRTGCAGGSNPGRESPTRHRGWSTAMWRTVSFITRPPTAASPRSSSPRNGDLERERLTAPAGACSSIPCSRRPRPDGTGYRVAPSSPGSPAWTIPAVRLGPHR